jgi:hypothetical protein
MASPIEGYRLVDDGYQAFKKIIIGRRWVGRVVKHAPHDYEAIIGSIVVRQATELGAFEAVVTKHLGRPITDTGNRRKNGRRVVIRPHMKTHVVAEQALSLLVEDYKAGSHPTTYGALAERCNFEKTNVRWFGQVTDLIDAACALAGVPSFALVRVREANGGINHAAWRNDILRDRVVTRALAGSWTGEDFAKIEQALAVFSAKRLGNKRAWKYVRGQISLQAWASVR